jgi:hypothetical protein
MSDKAREFCRRLTELERELGVELVSNFVAVMVDNAAYAIEVFEEDEGWMLVVDEVNRIVEGNPKRAIPKGVLKWR